MSTAPYENETRAEKASSTAALDEHLPGHILATLPNRAEASGFSSSLNSEEFKNGRNSIEFFQNFLRIFQIFREIRVPFSFQRGARRRRGAGGAAAPGRAARLCLMDCFRS